MDNAIVLNIPTDLTGSSGDGLNFNYDFGGNTSTIANSAYSFLNGVFSNNTAFLGNAISQSQTFLSAQIQPTVQAASAQIKQNTKMLPSLYDNLFSLGNTATNLAANLSNAALDSETSIANNAMWAQSNASSAASNAGGGMCFITTAVCQSLHLPDDNPVLNTLRAFRDDYMLTHSPADVKLYYSIAPRIVARIDERHDAAAIYRRMLRCFLLPACRAIKEGDNEMAYLMYRALVNYAECKAYGHA